MFFICESFLFLSDPICSFFFLCSKLIRNFSISFLVSLMFGYVFGSPVG
jgi:hypothetical protein